MELACKHACVCVCMYVYTYVGMPVQLRLDTAIAFSNSPHNCAAVMLCRIGEVRSGSRGTRGGQQVT